MKFRKIAVIGAGASGLATLKWLRAMGLSATAYDGRESVGGLWNLDPEGAPASTPAYPGLSMNTSRRISGYSDFPHVGPGDSYPSREDVLDYLNGYAERMQLSPHIHLRTRVSRAVQADDGRWTLELESEVEKQKECFDGLVVCTGRHFYPHFPSNWDMSGFEGAIMHSQEYADPAPFHGKSVLLVGTGASAADLAVQISRTARQVLVSARSGRWIIPRDVNGKPLDHYLSRVFYALPPRLRMSVMRRAILSEFRRLRIKGGGRDIGLPVPGLDLSRIRLTLNTDLLKAVQLGTIQVKPEIASFSGHEVSFADGSKECVDVAIFATGYQVAFPFMDLKGFEEDGSDFSLYRYVFPADNPGLAFVGLVNVQGPFGPVYEMQARWVASVFSGRSALPSPEAMREEIQRRHRRLAATGSRPNLVSYFGYMEEIASLLDVRPRLLRRPRLFPSLLFGPVCATHYRLDGPEPWEHAARSILKGTTRRD